MPQIKLSEDQTLRLEEAARSVGHGWSFVLLCSGVTVLEPNLSNYLHVFGRLRVAMAAHK